MKRIISVLLAALTLLLMAACGQQASGSEAQSVVEPKASQMKSICELPTMEERQGFLDRIQRRSENRY